MSNRKVFGRLDKLALGIGVSLLVLVTYAKMLSDFAELYVTGHTKNFLWILGDIFVSPGNPNNPGPYSLMGLIMVAVLGWANMHIWIIDAEKVFKAYMKYADAYVQHGVARLTDWIIWVLEESSQNDTRRGRLSTKILKFLEERGRQLEASKKKER